MGEFVTAKGGIRRNMNGTLFLGTYDCDYCMHGGRCRMTGHSTGVSCLCPDGYQGKRCHKAVIDIGFSQNGNPSNSSSILPGIVIGAGFLVVIAIIAFFLWRHYRKSNKGNSKKTEINKMKKMSIEGISVIGDKPSIRNNATPVCIAIDKENPSQLYVKLSPEVPDYPTGRSSKTETVCTYKANGGGNNSVALVG